MPPKRSKRITTGRLRQPTIEQAARITTADLETRREIFEKTSPIVPQKRSFFNDIQSAYYADIAEAAKNTMICRDIQRYLDAKAELITISTLAQKQPWHKGNLRKFSKESLIMLAKIINKKIEQEGLEKYRERILSDNNALLRDAVRIKMGGSRLMFNNLSKEQQDYVIEQLANHEDIDEILSQEGPKAAINNLLKMFAKPLLKKKREGP